MASNSEDFWLISVPGGEKSPQEAWEKLFRQVQSIASIFKFNIPNLKVGTLDQLFGLSDDLNKLDNFVESVTRKVAQYLSEVLEHEKDKLAENLMANNVDCITYVTKFDWDYAKYPIKQPLKSIAETISKQVSQIENDLKSKATAYNAIKQSLQALQKKQTGSLLTRNLGDILKKEDFVLDSEYLTTLIVIIPKHQIDEWFANYETICEYVVPRSSKKLFEDAEQILVNVTMFQKVVDTFKIKCRDRKFLVREFNYDEQAIAKDLEQIKTLEQNKKDKFGPLVRWLKINFSEAVTAWVHIKALRLFVESVLRYGLPVNFQAAIIKPQKKTTKKLRETLESTYSYLNTTGEYSKKELGTALEIPGLTGSALDYYPYVFFTLNLDFLDR
jgi:V-type H+-transporting ATPase subunit C